MRSVGSGQAGEVELRRQTPISVVWPQSVTQVIHKSSGEKYKQKSNIVKKSKEAYKFYLLENFLLIWGLLSVPATMTTTTKRHDHNNDDDDETPIDSLIITRSISLENENFLIEWAGGGGGGEQQYVPQKLTPRYSEPGGRGEQQYDPQKLTPRYSEPLPPEKRPPLFVSLRGITYVVGCWSGF